jgi:putative two-component system response regulator
LTAEEADVIEQAGRVHDIGKTALDSNILTKPGKLTDAEWEQMRMHPVHGANVVARFAAYQNGARVVRHHHEAWDGSGYPDGLAGEAIPLGARIIAVADTFDAMTTNRPYRDGMSVAKAIEVLEDGAGRQWDERVVRAIVEWLGEQHGELPAFRAGGAPLPAVENPLVSPRGAVVTAGME